MAYSCLVNQRTQCMGWRRVPQFRLWIWCIIIDCMISLPCISASCTGVDISVALYPGGSIEVLYGNPIELFCVAEKYTAEDMELMRGNTIIHTDIYNTTTRRWYDPKPIKQCSTVYCRNKRTKQNCATRVLVDSAPMNVTDFSCVSMNLEMLNCSWTAPESFSNTDSSVTYLFNGNFLQPVEAVKVDKLRYCTWNSTSYPRYMQLESEFTFRLKACNVFGCNSQNFTIDHYAIVKPDPPSDLKVIANDSHSVMLRWNIPFNMADLLNCGVEHKIEYQIAKIDNTAYFHSVNTSSLPFKNKTNKFLLSNLPYAHMQYEVRIYIRSKKAVRPEFWSPFTYILFYTASERPRRPPEMITGAFDQAIFENKRVIYVYWKQLEEYEEGGDNFTYKVIATTGAKSAPPVYPEKNKSMSYVILDKASLEAIDVIVWSRNEMGSSYNSSHLYIPSRNDTKSLSVPSFTKLAYENGTYKLSWVGIKNIDNYTLFWCQHNTTKICAGRMNFTVLDGNKTAHVIDLPRKYKYQFAISANHGSKTSGMVWATCDISRDGIEMYGYPVKVDHDASGKTDVRVTWRMQCTLQEGIIKGYLIHYCPVVRTSSDCDRTEKNYTVYISDPTIMAINITNLKPYKTYQFTLSLNTSYGIKTLDNASTGVTTTEDTPTSPRNVAISDVQSDSLIISWDPPQPRNGVIGRYVIFNDGEEFQVDKVHDKDKENDSRRYFKLKRLQAFKNYSLAVQACNSAIGSCSISSPKTPVFVRTRIGPPSRLKAPKKKTGESVLKWEPPTIHGGTLDLYQVKIIKDDKQPLIVNTTKLYMEVLLCEKGVSLETYQVRALNFDNDRYHGVLGDNIEALLSARNDNVILEYPSEWSEPITVSCESGHGFTVLFIFMGIVAFVGIIYGSIKFYHRCQQREDIKVTLPNGLAVPEKDITTKFAYGGWNPTNNDEKPSSDEMLLLPNSRTNVPSPDVKQLNNENNCGSSDHTDSTALSDTSRGAVERQASTSDDGSDSSLHLEEQLEPIRVENGSKAEEDSIISDSEISQHNSPYLDDKAFKKNPTSGYVQHVVNPGTGYVQSAPALLKISPSKTPPQPATTSYVMAGLSPPIFTTGVAPPSIRSHPPTSSGYVQPEDVQARSMLNFSKLGPSPNKIFGPESLPTMPTLPQPSKHGVDSSYIQLQSLDALPSHKQPRNSVPLKPPTSSGYVSPGDAVINKHLNNMLSAGQLAEESAILDPTMSPDAYCRFSWSTDPANDNLHSFLADSQTINSSKI